MTTTALALRLAALELHLERNVALPFVADDLLVNFDDARAKAALVSLRASAAIAAVALVASPHEGAAPATG